MRITRQQPFPAQTPQPGDELEVDQEPQTSPPPRQRDVLPPAARAKLIALQGEATDARDAAASASRRMNELKQALGYGDKPPPNAPGIEMEIGRLHSIREVQDRRHRTLADLASNIQSALTGLSPAVMLEPARPSDISPNDGETVAQAIERLRAEIAHTQEVLRTVEAAPPPKAVLKQQAEAHVEALAKRGAARVTVVNGVLDVQFGIAGSYAPGGTASATAVLAWMHPAQMISRLCAVIDRMPESPHAMHAERKAERLADIRNSILQLERWECTLIAQTRAAGTDVLPRVDVSALAFLGIQHAKPKKAKAA